MTKYKSAVTVMGKGIWPSIAPQHIPTPCAYCVMEVRATGYGLWIWIAGRVVVYLAAERCHGINVMNIRCTAHADKVEGRWYDFMHGFSVSASFVFGRNVATYLVGPTVANGHKITILYGFKIHLHILHVQCACNNGRIPVRNVRIGYDVIWLVLHSGLSRSITI